MMIIDSYCERILEKQTPGVVSVLPGGVSREEFIWRLDILIKEMYGKLTGYSEAEFRCGKALLLLLKKYCFSRKSIGNIQMESDFSDYLNKTEKMMDDQLSRLVPDANGMIPVLDADRTLTIISNTMQLLTSVMQARRQDREKTNAQVLGINLPIMVDKQVRVALTRENTAIENIVPYIDQANEISAGFEKAKKNENGAKTPFVEWVEFRYLKTVLELTKCKLDEIGVF